MAGPRSQASWIKCRINHALEGVLHQGGEIQATRRSVPRKT